MSQPREPSPVDAVEDLGAAAAGPGPTHEQSQASSGSEPGTAEAGRAPGIARREIGHPQDHQPG